MNRARVALALAGVLGLGACQQGGTSAWFDGDFDSALGAARERQTLVLLEFYTDWCNWCRRLESDTFKVPEVRRELAEFVALKQNAEKEGERPAARYGVDSYPTFVFLDPDGNEVDRMLGYLPPDKFLYRLRKIRTGDTFLACLRTLKEDPGDVEAIKRSVEGLLERSDPEGAIGRINAFHQATEGSEQELCRRLMFEARVELHRRVYQRAARLYVRGWDRAFEVPDTAGTERLHALIREGLSDWPANEQADGLRAARHDDASSLLELPDLESTKAKGFFDIASFAFSNGHFDVAADLYLQWYDLEGSDSEPGVLNEVAWRLYLSRTELEAATEIARRANEEKATPENTDTLARLLYVTGSVDEAIALERRAAELADGPESEAYRAVAEMMEAGETLDDRPSFDSYPGIRRIAM